MAIDKIFPSRLNTDSEERALKGGAMTDAMNVTISEDGEGTAAVVKNVKGTIPGEPFSLSDEVLNNKRITAIGSASDPQRGFIYYIVADAGNATLKKENAVYQYNVVDDTYKVVLKDRRFNFDPASFVKVDVVNADIARNGTLQTILFFTDNINPPRKINVDRAIAGEYSDISNRDFEYSLNCIKAPSVYAPTATFVTDPSIDTNLFRDEAFQFATQLIYKDGEESAISPYSRLAVPTRLTIHNVEGKGASLSPNADNVCFINPNITAEGLISSPDVSKVRILFRSGNNGAFNVADELPLNEPTSRHVCGNYITVFNGSNLYKYYNDKVVYATDPGEVNKLFDNVPYEAKGQAVSGNRLMYSNYTEGRENTDVSATMNVKYSKPDLGITDLIVPTGLENELVDGGLTDNFNVEDSIVVDGAVGYAGAGMTFRLKKAFGLEDASDAELQSFIVPGGTTTSLSIEVPLNIPAGTEIPADFTFTAVHEGIANNASANTIPISSCEVNITSIEINNMLDQEPLLGNQGLVGTPYFNLTPSGELDTPVIDISFGTPADMPFMSITGEYVDNYFDLFAEQIDGFTFQSTYYGRIKGTQGDVITSGENNLGGAQDLDLGLFFDHTVFAPKTFQTDNEFQSWKTGLVTLNMSVKLQESSLSSGELLCNLIPLSAQGWEHSDKNYILLQHPEYEFGGLDEVIEGSQLFTIPPTIPLLFDQTDGNSFFNGDEGVPVDGGFADFSDQTPGSFPALLEGTGVSDEDLATLGYIDIGSLNPLQFLPFTTYLYNIDLSVTKRLQVSGFKAGAIHNFGVVYYDQFNRSSFVNEIGNVYVEWFNKQGNNFRGDQSDVDNYRSGPASIEFKINNDPPEWAETYQIVYPGNSTMSEFVQYTFGDCWPARIKHELDDSLDAFLPNRNIDTEGRRLYVSLETLDQYRLERNTYREYSFTQGDKLRVISHQNPFGANLEVDTLEDDLDHIYKGASDGTIIEFDVVGVEVLVKDLDNPIAYGLTGEGMYLSEIRDEHTGKFLVLEQSGIAGAALGEDGNQLKYPGFDWNHVSAHYRDTTATQGTDEADENDFDYSTPADDVPTPVNSWRQRAVVEIFSPKKSSENEFYYEIGERRHIGKYEPAYPSNEHGPKFVLDAGDISFRPVPCKTFLYNEESTTTYNLFDGAFNKLVYKTEELESFTVSDKMSEKMWNKGRPHVKYTNAAVFRRFNGITYSDAYAEDVDRFSLTSFNATRANFYSLDSQYGACNYISNYGAQAELVGIQENKFSKTPVNKSIILDGSGAGNLALSTSVLNSSTYYSGDYGCGDHPESVLIQDNTVYFFDRSRKKVLRFTGNQLVPISDQGVSSVINDTTDAFNKVFNRKSGRIISGYNPDDNVYYITFHYPQALSHRSEEQLDLVPLYLTSDLNQDQQVNVEDKNIFQDHISTLPDDLPQLETIFDVSFEALDEDNPNLLTLTGAVSFDLNNDGLENEDDVNIILDDLNSDNNYSVPSFPVSTIIGDVKYTQYVDIYDADGNPVPVVYNGLPIFIDVSTEGNPIVFGNGLAIVGGSNEGSGVKPDYLKEYGDFITLSYNAEGNFWQSRNSYYPDLYVNQDNKMYTAQYVVDSGVDTASTAGNALMFHRHEDLKTQGGEILNRCTFYNQPTSESFVEVVSHGGSPSSVKVYDALSYESDSAKFSAAIESFLGNEKGMASIQQTDFVKKEGSYYSAIGGDVSENSTNHIRPLGYVVGTGVAFVDGTITGKIVINDAPTGAIQGAVLKAVDDLGVLSNIGANPQEEITIQGGMETVDNGVSIDVSGLVGNSIIGSTVVMELPRDRDGDSIRGHYTKIKLSTKEGDNVGKYELFCVNAHVTPSDLHHIN
mgnify:CR=1 FL=1|tara:strand:+ start:1561 stop:7131 length:5571 start_codon:yes stop_codon:yes gene_type:complete